MKYYLYYKDVKIWDIIAELVRVCTVPAPPNPFAVDFDYFEMLLLPEKLLVSGAMVNFFQRLLQGEHHSYNKRGQLKSTVDSCMTTIIEMIGKT